MTKQEILDAIEEFVTTNGIQEITGQILNLILTSIATIIPDDTMLTSSFGGIVTPASNIVVTPGQQKWFFANPGTYANAGGLVFAAGKLNILSYDGANWQKFEVDMPTDQGMIEIPFSTFIKFENNKSVSKTTLSGPANFSYVSTNAKPNAIEVKEIIPNGYPITFNAAFTTKIQSDIDYSKPITIMFHRPITASLKPLALVLNTSEVDNTIPLPKFKVNAVGASSALINTWFVSFEFPNHTVTANDCVYNIGIFNYQGVNYLTGNFTTVGAGANGRWANFSIPESQWEAGKIFDPDGTNIAGVRITMGNSKPTSLVQANTSDYTLIQI
ncbi:hypothetical protein [Chryseobacterium sp. ZHDP1]|uniref:hypothetical protein n=1 Tax=Chryseobacterium sp. ZHDP1 TaxID=2838877 RepID=UPI001BE127C1|nr:hypothetical protein [Chryseobacterium sp. ZHDP1]QWA38877.1 hypothetical protein KKI44_01310 [Chryseobacterium sp. ZHDP1]